jgi:phosphatidylglycerophosphate synthase
MSTAPASRAVGAATRDNSIGDGRRERTESARGWRGVSIKDRDACWTVFAIDPIAVPLAAWAARLRWVTPNRLTSLSALLALGAAASFAAHQLVLGALVYQLSFLVDCMDGKVASVRGLAARWGGFFDIAGDTVRFVACFLALALVTVAGQDSWHLLPVLLYPCARFGLLAMAEARPGGSGRGKVTVAPAPWAVLRLASRRATKPGTTVDAEAVALTFGPLTHQVTLGFAIAAALHLLHVAVLFTASVRSNGREQRRAVRGA